MSLNDTTPKIPCGYCHCGCGQKTPLAPKTQTKRGWIKGQPIRYILRHQRNHARPIVDRFWQYVIPGPIDRCWPWSGYTNPGGYGRMTIGKRKAAAHRICWELHFGCIPQGMEICHKCDNPLCCNPHHLFLGTQLDNMADMDSKGRRAFRSKLTGKQVMEIRKRSAEGESHVGLAGEFGISKTSVREIVHRETWRHI